MKLKYLTIFFFIALIILTPSLAHAAWWNPLTWLDTAAAAALSIITYIITHIAAFIVGWVLRFSSFFLEWAINPGIGSITGQPFVASGVLITRSIANLMLIAILLIISIATIIGIESYGIRKALPMLIGVALLINFSSVVTGLVIDAGQVPLEFFIEKAFPSDFSIGKAFQKSLHLDDISISNFDIIGTDESFSEQFTTARVASNFIISLIVIIIGLMASFMFFKLGILLLLRYVAFWILTILAPFVFAISVFPSTRKYLTKWFTHLLEWSFLGVIATFFIYLALLVLVSFDISSSAIFKENIGEGGGFMGNFGITLISLFTVYFFLQYGYNISKKMAGEGAMAIVNGIGNLVKSGATLAGGAVLGGVALGGKAVITRTVGRIFKGKDDGNKSSYEIGKDRLNKFGARMQTGTMGRLGGRKFGEWFMDKRMSEKDEKYINQRAKVYEVLAKDMTQEERDKYLAKIFSIKDKAAFIKATSGDATGLGINGVKEALKLTSYMDERTKEMFRSRYEYIVKSFNPDGSFNKTKYNDWKKINNPDSSKLSYDLLDDLNNNSHKDILDNITMDISENELNKLSTFNRGGLEKILNRAKEVRADKKLQDKISKETGVEISQVIKHYENLRIYEDMGPSVSKFSRRVTEKYDAKEKEQQKKEQQKKAQDKNYRKNRKNRKYRN